MADVTDLTAYPIGGESLAPLKRNASDLDELVNNPSGTVENRAGDTLRTYGQLESDFIAGGDAAIATFESDANTAIATYTMFTARGAWVTATAYALNDVWTHTNGDKYLVLESYTSGANEAADIAGGTVTLFRGRYQEEFTSLAAMKAASPSYAGQSFYLSAGGRSGTFETLPPGDYSAEIAADPLEGVYVLLNDGQTLKRRLNGYVTPGMFGFSESDNVDLFLAFCETYSGVVQIDIAVTYSNDHIFTGSLKIVGNGSLSAEAGSGAALVFEGDNSELGIPVLGNEIKSSNIVSTNASEIVVIDGSDYTAGDQIITLSTDEFRRVVWVGYVDSVLTNTLTVSDNVIDGNFSNIVTGQPLYIISSSRWTGKVIFGGKSTPVESPVISTNRVFSRSIEFSNCNNLSHGKLNTFNASLVYLFAYNSNAGDVVSEESVFYARSIQGSKGGVYGSLHAINPYFSGHVEKGLYDAKVGDCHVEYAPVMSLQTVSYPGSMPSTLNSNLQSDLLNSSVRRGDLSVVGGNWIAAIKDVTGDFTMGDIISVNAYKSFFPDVNLSVVRFKNLIVNGHNVGGSARTENSSAAIYSALSGLKIFADNIHISEADTGSSNGCGYFSNVDLYVSGELSISGSESFVSSNNADFVVNRLSTADNTDGFQIVKCTDSTRVDIKSILADESINTNLDRLVFVTGSSSNVDIASAGIKYGGSLSPTDGIRLNCTGDNISARNATTSCYGSATCINSVRSTGVASSISIIAPTAGSGVTNSALVSGVTDTLRINLANGTVVDSSSATTKDVTTGNI